MEDYEIVALYHEREERAILESASKYGRLLHRMAWDILKNYEDSEEMVNDTYGKAWDSMPPNRPNSLCAYLGRIVRNLSISRYRSKHAMKREGVMVELTDVVQDGKKVDDEIALRELTKAIECWLEMCSREDRILFIKRYFFAEGVGTLAVEAGYKESQITGKLYRLRTSLKKYLEQEGYLL